MSSLAIGFSDHAGLLHRIRAASPALWWTSIAFLAAFAICLMLTMLDPRLFNGISVWTKPAKFFLSPVVQMLTLSFALLLLPEKIRMARPTTLATGTMAAMAVFEMAYITFRAGLGEASHFNTSSTLAVLLYNLMGVAAALMMLVTLYMGVQVLRHGSRSLMARATGWGFIAAALMTLVIGFTLGGMGSHWIGGDQTDATGLPIIGWSTTGGDLRAAHFFGLHIMQILPLAALTGRPARVWLAGLAMLALTVAAFVLALNGIPLIRL